MCEKHECGEVCETQSLFVIPPRSLALGAVASRCSAEGKILTKTPSLVELACRGYT